MSPLAPAEAGPRVAAFYARAVPRLFGDLADAGAAPGGADAREQARAEWECYALFACVRGIVAASGFAPRTVETIDSLHAAVFAAWDASAGATGGAARRELLSKRYPEYEAIAQTGGAAGAHDAAVRLGAAAATHMAAAAAHMNAAAAPDDLAEVLGSMHETLAESVVALLSDEAALPAESAPEGIATPPLEGAWRIVERLERAGLTVALGGSGLLAALGLAREVHDWDLNTDAPREAVERALAGLEWVHKGADELHADEKFMLPELDLEIIRGFAFFTPAGIVRLPTVVTRRWAGLPVGSPVSWVAAYHLLDRTAKRDALLEWIARNGAEPNALGALRAQALPGDLDALLRTLPLAAD